MEVVEAVVVSIALVMGVFVEALVAMVEAMGLLDEILECDTDFEFMWMQTHMKKGSRLLDKLKEISSSIDETKGENDANCPILEEIVESTNVNDWIGDRSRETYQNYKRLDMDKRKRGGNSVDEIESEDDANRPIFNKKLWEQAGGRSQKGKTYGIGCISSSSLCGFQRADPETQRLKERIEELEKENAIEKAANEAMCERLAANENFLKMGKI